MRIAVLADIHSNLHAFTAVLEDLRPLWPDRVVCLGDVVGYGAHPNECLVRLFEVADIVVAGNHDEAAVDRLNPAWFNSTAAEAALWTRQNLTREHREALLELELTFRMENLLFVHGGPEDPADFPYVRSRRDAHRQLRAVPPVVDTVFVGHTHVPADYRHDDGRLINPGSVGQPRDDDPRAAWSLFDTETGQAELRRVDYDVDGAAEAIRRAGLPPFLAERLFRGY